jgi:hypothetical protein
MLSVKKPLEERKVSILRNPDIKDKTSPLIVCHNGNAYKEIVTPELLGSELQDEIRKITPLFNGLKREARHVLLLPNDVTEEFKRNAEIIGQKMHVEIRQGTHNTFAENLNEAHRALIPPLAR